MRGTETPVEPEARLREESLVSQHAQVVEEVVVTRTWKMFAHGQGRQAQGCRADTP
jgi:hypothetical protein